MAIDLSQLVLTAREMLSELPESVHFSRENLRALVKPAISLWQSQTNADITRRQNFIVDSAAINVVDGVADIGPEVDAKGFRLDFIRESDIVLPYQLPTYTVKFVNSFDRLMSTGRQDKFYILAYLSRTRLTFREAGEVLIDTMNGTFILRSTVIPVDPAVMPVSVMPEIAMVIADLARARESKENRGLDIPPK